MKSWLKSCILGCAFLYASPVYAEAASGVGLSFEEWIEEFRREAIENEISAQALDEGFVGIELQPYVISLDRRQPELRKDFQSYMDNAINNLRIKKARNLMETHVNLLKEVSEKYGVPAHYLIAFWGMETNFGTSKGNFPTIGALATLAYDTRRPVFFRSELMHAMKMIQAGVGKDKLKGSWAGAMGNFQFMPSTYRHFGVDYDDDGYVDLWESLPDAFASAANYLSSEGWNKNVDWGREVFLPKRFNWELIEKKKTLADWKKEGIIFPKNNPVTEPLTTEAELFLPAGIQGPAFLVYSNFRVILKWNNSVLYAIAVGHLADRIIEKPDFVKKYTQKGSSFTMEESMEVQELLKKMGLYNDSVDGVLGRRSREAVRRFQALYDLPADGYANPSLLHFMRLALVGGVEKNQLSFDEIREVQTILSKGQYYKGPIDGKLGKASKKGIELYKKVYGIRSENINRKLLEKMRVQFARDLENDDIDPLVKESIRQEEEQKKEALRLAQKNKKKAAKRKTVGKLAQKTSVKKTPTSGK